MKLSEEFYLLKEVFNPDSECIDLPGSSTTILNLDFSCPLGIYDTTTGLPGFPSREDGAILENRNFKYPVFVPQKNRKYSSFIILLHGLNERSWFKHLAWARYLCENTGKPVIMFPISFHMNRSHPAWTDRNELALGLKERQLQYADLKESSFINLTLSNRLTEVPQRFFLSGYQSALDLIALLKDINSGKHILFEKNSHFDVFAYSIGVFLAECMMIANPSNIFDNSRFVFFAGGALFQEMNGISKYIMDSEAFRRVYHYHMKEMDEDIRKNPSMRNVLKDNRMGKAFRSMVAIDRLRNFREKALKKYRNRVLCLPLAGDKVIPAEPSVELLSATACSKKFIRIMDFKFPAIHENPFPLNLKEYTSRIDEAFLRVFSLSADFLR
ncbi:MAG: hypothetical protein H6540_01870 [Bacteroidales bacterium]|nr:hypothetical protein [Bacteroidales bacterium]MCB9013909.1 hypothetical protein [Bacteroidales bacterium]